MSLLTNVLKLWRTGQYLLPADSGFMVKHLFASGELGFAKLDFSGFAGMYQDRARTIPYTAVEQPLGSFTGLNGVTATAPADVNRGVVSARVNSLLNTENPSAWPTSGITGTAEAGGVSLLQSTADSSQINPSSQYPIGSTPISNSCVYRSIEYLPGDALYLAYGPASGGSFVTIRTSDGVVVGAVGGASPLRKITQLVDGWVRVETWDSLASHSASQLSSILYFGNTFTYPYIATTGRAGTQIRVRQLQYVVLPFGSTHSVPYQRVNTPTDYDTAGFSHYLAFNGTNTTYTTPSIDFTGTDKMTVWAGVTKLSDAAPSTLLELSVNSYSNLGTIGLFTPTTVNGNDIVQRSKGTSERVLTVGGFTSPMSFVVTGYMGITPPIIGLRIAGSVIGTTSASQGTGNYGNYPLYIGARAGASLFFNGRLYNLIVRGAESSISQIEAVEILIRQKMRLP